MREVSASEVRSLITNGSLMVVDCYAPWCGPCGALKPRLEAVSKDYEDKGVEIVTLNVDENQDFAKEHDVRSIPTLLFYKSGKVVHEMHGVPSEKRICDKLDELRGS
jgi:thioredoxin